MNHGSAVFRRLVEPWLGSDRVVCADSYFASVEAADQMKSVGLRFIGAIKTATRQFPYRFLSDQQMPCRFEWLTLVRKKSGDIPDMMANNAYSCPPIQLDGWTGIGIILCQPFPIRCQLRMSYAIDFRIITTMVREVLLLRSQ